jgi:IclR family transcriptional regulator, KDG regulon repressor
MQKEQRKMRNKPIAGHDKPSASAARRHESRVLHRYVDLLEGLAGNESLLRGGLGVARTAAIVGRDKSQVSRALRSLEAEGLVERDPDTLEYQLGWRLYALAARACETRLVRTALPYMRELAARLGETVHLCVLRGAEVVTLVSESPPHAFRASAWEGRGAPVICTSAGRVLVMDYTFEELRARFGDPDFACGGPRRRISTVDALYKEILAIRLTGYAKVDEEFEAQLVGVSAPIRDFRDRVIAAINVSAPRDRLGARLDEAGRATAAVATELSRRFGWGGRTVTAGAGRLS